MKLIWAFVFYRRSALAGWRVGKARCDMDYLLKRVGKLMKKYRNSGNAWAFWEPVQQPHNPLEGQENS